MRKTTLENLKKRGALCPARVEDGFAQYKNMILEGHGQQLRLFLEEQVQENGWQDSWVDFYYGTLSEAEREKARSVLTEEQKSWLDGQEIGKQDLYFQMDAVLFEITYRLSITGMLFSTYYFTKVPCTVWSSFDGKAVVFGHARTSFTRYVPDGK